MFNPTYEDRLECAYEHLDECLDSSDMKAEEIIEKVDWISDLYDIDPRDLWEYYAIVYQPTIK